MSRLFGLPDGVHGSAAFSKDKEFRYSLERRWNADLPQFTFILLNPSEAGADRDDETSQRLHALTMANGGGGFELINLFAKVDTDQIGLTYPAAVGETVASNDEWIAAAVSRSRTLVLGWGDGSSQGVTAAAREAGVRRRAREVWPMVRFYSPRCFKVNASGSPGHPLYLKSTSRISRYSPKPDYPWELGRELGDVHRGVSPLHSVVTMVPLPEYQRRGVRRAWLRMHGLETGLSKLVIRRDLTGVLQQDE
jgi:hypothetical protein